MMKAEEKSILITGAASGIGRAAARAFLERGYTVYALDMEEIPAVEGLIPLTADVRDEAALAAIAERLAEEGVRLSAILCSAGIHRMSSLLEERTETLRRVIDVNLVGTMLVCRLFHRLLGEGGRIVLVTSEVATYDPLPFNGLYTVSKVALESYAQALRQELSLLGQRVVTVRPGAVDTPLAEGTGMAAVELAGCTELYLREAHRFVGLTARFQGKPIPPERLARLLVRTVETRRPRLSYNCHRHAGLILLSALPKRLQCAIVRCLLRHDWWFL